MYQQHNDLGRVTINMERVGIAKEDQTRFVGIDRLSIPVLNSLILLNLCWNQPRCHSPRIPELPVNKFAILTRSICKGGS